MPEIHSTAIVDSKAELAEDVKIGPFTIVEGDVVIESGTQIDAHVLVADGARIGKNCRFHQGAVVGSLPQDLKFGGEKTTLEIGDNTVIREYCDLNRGTKHRGKSAIGKNSFLMAYTHVAHDCLIGDNVILANAVQLAGHVTIEDWVIVGGMVPIHQFCTIGQHAFVGGAYRVVQDIPPYILAAGEPLTYKGLNRVGLKRRGFSKEAIKALYKLYRLLYRAKLNKSQALEIIRSEVPDLPEVKTVLDFIEHSERGIIR
ncbi:acyl-ACP--UDP-N-acetylglucosamine O-acyltransferase [candidate division KSB1 bacterium]|nr:acyl-ACP--UDP-N-acetylglucosamine O-acyltransferase [candidate division KSB1 bacterium]